MSLQIGSKLYNRQNGTHSGTVVEDCGTYRGDRLWRVEWIKPGGATFVGQPWEENGYLLKFYSAEPVSGGLFGT